MDSEQRQKPKRSPAASPAGRAGPPSAPSPASSAVTSALQGSVLKASGRAKRIVLGGAQGVPVAQELEALNRSSCAFRTQEWEKLIQLRAWLTDTLLKERRMRASVSTNLVLQVAVRLLERSPEVVETALMILAEDLRRNVPTGAQGEPAVSLAPVAAASSQRAAG